MSDETTLQQDPETPVKAPAARPQGKAAELPSFSAGMEGKPTAVLRDERAGSIELLRDVNLELTVELGRTRMNIGELMELGQGSVIELDKMAGEPVDVRVNGVLLASGEVIVLDDVFGVRITRLHNRVDRADTFGD
ncbi:MAG: flagellar motor switch protein FliN [Candidatus Krumholzibacteriia bacterium]|nr:flagellar motor switch protein FliN [bacterium]MCB9515189.1 flagellar motor switch protein FliN [Candidatus Latescibacterota bacterium]